MKTEVTVDAWIGDSDSEEYWAEGVKASLEVEVTDADEVRLGVLLKAEESDAVSLFLSRAEADRLSRFLAAAVAAEVSIGVASPA